MHETQEMQVRSLGWGRSPWEGNGTPLQYSCLGNPMDGGAKWATVYGVAKSWTWLSDWTHKTIRGKFGLPQDACDEQRSRTQKMVLLPCILEAPPDSLNSFATCLLPGRSKLDTKAYMQGCLKVWKCTDSIISSKVLNKLKKKLFTYYWLPGVLIVAHGICHLLCGRQDLFSCRHAEFLAVECELLVEACEI